MKELITPYEVRGSLPKGAELFITLDGTKKELPDNRDFVFLVEATTPMLEKIKYYTNKNKQNYILNLALERLKGTEQSILDTLRTPAFNLPYDKR